ncbi:MAG: hypothetical protein WC375_00090 [Methanomassiliicoccales archaeon]|jgi:hypothetical protein
MSEIATTAEVKTMAEDGERYTMEQLGVPASRQKLIDSIANAPKAGIIFVSGYESVTGCGEVANYFYLKGIDYGNMKKRSLAIISKLESDPDFKIHTKYYAWVDAEGVESNRRAKDRKLEIRKHEYKHGDSLLTEAFAKVRKSIEAPRPPTVEYEKEGNGVYDLAGVLYIRDCLLICKEVTRKGDRSIKATSELVALSDAIERLTPRSKYRAVKLDGRFGYISVGGQLVMQNEGGAKTFIGFREHAGLVEPRIMSDEDRVEQEKEEVETLRIISDMIGGLLGQDMDE